MANSPLSFFLLDVYRRRTKRSAFKTELVMSGDMSLYVAHCLPFERTESESSNA